MRSPAPGPEGAEADKAVRLGVDFELTDDAAREEVDAAVETGVEVVVALFGGSLLAEELSAPDFLAQSRSGSGKKVEQPKLSDGACFGLRFAMVAKT